VQTANDGPADSLPAKPARSGTAASHEGRLIRMLLRAFGNPPVEFVLWTGERIATGDTAPLVTLRVADRATLLELCMDPDMQFGDAYSDGRIELEGDLLRFIESAYAGVAGGRSAVALARRFAQWRHHQRTNTLHGARRNIHHHYDIGNEFYSLWLGETMAYTCAYFPAPEATLDEAQVAKMHHVCRKVRLQPGQQVVEAGCGWGSLALHMARYYGVKVRAFNISGEQISYARRRAHEAGLDGQVEFIEDDYRNITGSYDAFVSVGMLEHVGPENYQSFGQLIRGCLKPGGLGLIHTIGRNRPKPMHRWIERRIFPGANPPSLAQMMDIFEPNEFSVLDVENLRLHYARTLQCWHELYERSRERITRMFDERFVRMWRLYLLGSIAAFTSGELQLFQVVFCGARNNHIPWTRAQVYRA
jgi:cyclopropane-fatty-acyl-phospholipid synthase